MKTFITHAQNPYIGVLRLFPIPWGNIYCSHSVAKIQINNDSCCHKYTRDNYGLYIFDAFFFNKRSFYNFLCVIRNMLFIQICIKFAKKWLLKRYLNEFMFFSAFPMWIYVIKYSRISKNAKWKKKCRKSAENIAES